MINGASPIVVSQAFGEGFWSLITFTMQMAFIVIGGYVVATSAPAQRLIRGPGAMPKSGTGAVGLVAAASMIASLLNWGFSLISAGFWCARWRSGATAHGLPGGRRRRLSRSRRNLGYGPFSSSAAQLQANPASVPKPLLAITGVIPFTETIFMWQSFAITAVLLAVSITIAILSAPGPKAAMTAQAMGIEIAHDDAITERRRKSPAIGSNTHRY